MELNIIYKKLSSYLCTQWFGLKVRAAKLQLIAVMSGISWRGQ
jgi:hypothetical protein